MSALTYFPGQLPAKARLRPPAVQDKGSKKSLAAVEKIEDQRKPDNFFGLPQCVLRSAIHINNTAGMI